MENKLRIRSFSDDHHHNTGPQYPGIQTRQLLQRGSCQVIMEEENEEEQSKVETIHIQSNTCNCAERQEKRCKYVTILDVDRYIESLNDWGLNRQRIEVF